MSDSWRGSCLCGAVAYEVRAFTDEVAHCHCGMCRKFHGAAFSTLATVRRGDFDWTSGEEQLGRFRAENGTVRAFCRTCGSSLTYETPRAPDSIEIALGTLDDEPPVRPDARLWTEFAAAWSEERDLPRFTRGRDSARSSEGAD